MAVPVTVKVSAFALAVMGSYSWYANSIPQIESKPPEELSLEGGNVTPAQLVAAGEKIFREKGQCTTCHGIGRAGRGPDLAGVGARAGDPEARHQGLGVPGRVAAQPERRTWSRASPTSCPTCRSRRSA